MFGPSKRTGTNMPKKYLADFNKEQRRAVRHGLNSKKPDHRPLLVLAGAGTGKTELITHRVAHLILKGTSSHRILLLAFGRLAAGEMTERAKRIVTSVNGIKVDLPWSGTFHSIGARLLRQHALQVGLRPSFTILDPSDTESLMNTVRSDLGFAKKPLLFPDKTTCLAIYSYVVNSQKPLKRTLTGQYRWCREWLPQLRRLFAAYDKKKRRQNVVDFDDLLSLWLALMNDKDTAAEIRDMFDHVLVDEYQDTNRLQAKILLKLKLDGRGLMVVGDDSQAIYSFRAATIRNILRFAKQFSPKARIIKLEQNYRSTQPILDACNAVIALAGEGYIKTLRSDRRSKLKPALIEVADERAQASMIAQEIINARNQGTALKEQAVLFRDARHSAHLELELTRRRVPFRKFGGRKFLEALPIKDAISVLRWCENPRDRLAGSRVLQLLPGIGSARATKMLDQLDGSLDEKALSGIAVSPPAGKNWAAFTRLVLAATTSSEPWPRALGLVRKWCEPHLSRKYGSSSSRLADLDQLEQLAKGYASCDRFLTELSLDPPDATDGTNPASGEDYVVLSTIHSAKGREWSIVRVLSVVDGVLPSRLATSAALIEEERRLLYVAMSRAKDQLQGYVPRRLFLQYRAGGPGQHHVRLKRSRFLPPSIFPFFERRDLVTKPAR
jgi:DNA helicase II / ATP-dependent DNA helicase PcrA